MVWPNNEQRVPRTIEQVEQDLRGWKTFEATCQEDYEHAGWKIRELTAEYNWMKAGYKVEFRMRWFLPSVPSVRVVSWAADEAAKVAGVPTEGEHFYAQTSETGTSAQGFVRLWPK